tara:strand:- start:14521 stop:15003 length:483 start_codon:yes stop_codon:yes gene_type:complete
MPCKNTFLCTSSVNIVGYDFEGIQWFMSLLILAFTLQIFSNVAWLRISQSYREILREKKHSKRRDKLIPYNLLWTGIWTSIFLLRIALIVGSNLWIFIVILLGNITGTAWALADQDQDILAESFQDVCSKDSWPDRVIEKLIFRIKQIENKTKQNKDLVL